MNKRPDDAAKVAGLASILGVGNKQKVLAAPPSPAPAAGKETRVGKYRDPAFHHYGFYLRKDTHKQVKRKLEDSESDKDVSDLLQELMEQWLASQ